MGADDVDYGLTNNRSSGGVNNEVLVKFGGIAGCIPEMDVGAGVDKRFEGLVDGSTVALEKECSVVDVVAVVKRDIPVVGFRAPNLGRDFNDEEGCKRRRERGAEGGRAGAKGNRVRRARVVLRMGSGSAGGVDRTAEESVRVVVRGGGEDGLEARCRQTGPGG
jgi:hypothetical protein